MTKSRHEAQQYPSQPARMDIEMKYEYICD